MLEIHKIGVMHFLFLTFISFSPPPEAQGEGRRWRKCRVWGGVREGGVEGNGVFTKFGTR